MNTTETEMPSPIQPETSLVTRYFEQLWKCIRTPSEFFKSLPSDLSVGYALTFGLLTYWIGAVLSYIWGMTFSFGVGELLNTLQSYDKSGQMRGLLSNGVVVWLLGAGSVLLAPIQGALMIALEALGIAFAFVLLVPKNQTEPGLPQANFSEALKIVALSYAGRIFLAVPFLGSVISWAFGLMLIAKAVQHRLRVSEGRAWFISLFPWLLQATFILLLVVILIAGMAWLFKSFT